MATQFSDFEPSLGAAENLETMLDCLPAGAVLAEAPSGRIVRANPQARHLWGGSFPQADSLDDYSALYVGYRPNGRQYLADEWPLARALRYGETVRDEEIEVRLDSGERRIILVSAAPVTGPDGITHAVALFNDITETRHEDRRREFLMQLTDDLRMIDDTLAILELAAAATGEQLGVSSTSYADIDPDSKFALVHAEYRNGRIVHDGKYYLEDFGVELARRIRVGSTVVVEDIASDPRPMKDVFEGWGLRSLIAAPIVRQGRLVALFSVLHNAPRRWTRSDIALVEQVAERTWHTVENARVEADLRRSQDLLSLALRSGSAAIWEWDLRTGRIRWSEEHAALLGATTPRRSLTFNRWLALVHADDRAAARLAARRVATMREGEVELEYRLAGSAEPRWINMRGRVIPDGRGVPRRVAGVAVDVTDRKLNELERENLLRQAREASDAKSHFIGVISHEFRTPLTAIIGYADLLSNGVSGELTPGQARQLDRIRAGAWHLTQLVDEILTFSRIDAGRETLAFERTDIAATVREATSLVRPAAALKRIGLACEMPDHEVTIETDAGKVRQILLNLLGNAVKFTHRGGVTIALRQKDDGVEFTVSDTGVGIAEADLPRIFERFWQVGDNTRSVSGAGLGLTVSKQLAEMLGGTISVESEPGEGSTFRLCLPSRPAG